MMNTNTNNLNTFNVNYDPNRSMEEVVYEDIERRFGENTLPIFIDDDFDFDKRISVVYQIEDGGRYRPKTTEFHTTEGDLFISKNLMEDLYKQMVGKQRHQRLTDVEIIDLMGQCRDVFVVLNHLKIRGQSKKVLRCLKKSGSYRTHIEMVTEFLSDHSSEETNFLINTMVGWYVSLQLDLLKDDNCITYTDRINLTDEEIDEIVEGEQNQLTMEVVFNNDLNELRKSTKNNGVIDIQTSFVGGVQ